MIYRLTYRLVGEPAQYELFTSWRELAAFAEPLVGKGFVLTVQAV